MAVQTGYAHIALNEKGVPIIEGTTTKVVELVAEVLYWGWNAETILEQHPYLKLGQIFSALAYYWDHADELHDDLRRREEIVDRLREKAGPSPLRAKLEAALAAQ